ncbi:hypothetical protein [Gryllotalpicola koreensis]|uniref:hypothetical protein n=1 Tax=Gryllotalpicola koreensis TaxID=993086 RepID=UPI0031D2D8A7
MDLAAWIQTIAGVLGIILAFVGIVIARRTFIDQREARTFESDLAYANELTETIEAIKYPMAQSPTRDFALEGQWNRAWNRYVRSVPSAGIRLSAYFSSIDIHYAQLHLGKCGPYSAEGRSWRIASVLTDAQQVARDWVFPERRERVLREIVYADRFRPDGMVPMHLDGENPRLIIRGWLIDDFPSDFRLWQRLRRFEQWARVLLDDVKRGRGKRRWREWRQTRMMHKSEMRFLRESQRDRV